MWAWTVFLSAYVCGLRWRHAEKDSTFCLFLSCLAFLCDEATKVDVQEKNLKTTFVCRLERMFLLNTSPGCGLLSICPSQGEVGAGMRWMLG